MEVTLEGLVNPPAKLTTPPLTSIAVVEDALFKFSTPPVPVVVPVYPSVPEKFAVPVPIFVRLIAPPPD